MGKSEDYIGQRFGRLTVLSIDRENTTKNTRYICRCDCGRVVSVSRPNLRTNTRSCGCLSRELSTTHGLSKSRIGGIYRSMLHRCNSRKDHAYKDYGGRGIKVCEEWQKDIHLFYNWAMENGYDDTLTLDRIDVNGNYEPSNCRWANRQTQANNTRENNHVIYGGKSYTVSELARTLGVSRNTIYRYYTTEKEVNKTNLFLTGCGNSYTSMKRV